MYLDPLETIKRWLEEGREDADKLLDVQWDVEVVDLDDVRGLVAINPRFPIKLHVHYIPEFNLIRLVINTNIKIAGSDKDERLEIYRKLLRLSRAFVGKIYIHGDEDEIAVAVDIGSKTLSKEEFYDKLAYLLLNAFKVYKITGRSRNLKEEDKRRLE